MLSAILFNCVVDIVFERWKRRLLHEGLYTAYGLERLTNSRYADDVLLYANSLAELQHMTSLLVEEFALVGLKLNASKTKILHTDLEDLDCDVNFADIGGELVKVLPVDSWHRYLGRRLSLS